MHHLSVTRVQIDRLSHAAGTGALAGHLKLFEDSIRAFGVGLGSSDQAEERLDTLKEIPILRHFASSTLEFLADRPTFLAFYMFAHNRELYADGAHPPTSLFISASK